MRDHLDWSGVIHDKVINKSWYIKLESAQCKVLLAMMGQFRTDTENLFQELGLEPTPLVPGVH